MLRQGDRFRLVNVPDIFNELWGNDAPAPMVGDVGVVLHVRPGKEQFCDVMLDKYHAWRTYDPSITVNMSCLELILPHVLDVKINGKHYIFPVYVDDDDEAVFLADRMVRKQFRSQARVMRPDGSPITSIGVIV